MSAWNQKAQKIFGKTDEDIITKEKIRPTLFFFLEFDPTKHLQQLDFTDVPTLSIGTKWWNLKTTIIHSFIVDHKAAMFPE